jgi:hypothetical protein
MESFNVECRIKSAPWRVDPWVEVAPGHSEVFGNILDVVGARKRCGTVGQDEKGGHGSIPAFRRRLMCNVGEGRAEVLSHPLGAGSF